jgi:hypothetical protein
MMNATGLPRQCRVSHDFVCLKFLCLMSRFAGSCTLILSVRLCGRCVRARRRADDGSPVRHHTFWAVYISPQPARLRSWPASPLCRCSPQLVLGANDELFVRRTSSARRDSCCLWRSVMPVCSYAAQQLRRASHPTMHRSVGLYVL